MTIEALSATQVEAIEGMSDEVRYNHFVSQAHKLEQLWTLSDDSGCLLLDTGEEKCIPLFCHPDLAAKWAAQDDAECQPLAISLADFVEKWLPGMSKDGFFVAVQPNLAGEGFVEAADDFAQNFSA